MTSLNYYAGYIGGVFTIIACISYIKAIIVGKVQSNRVTWGIWVLVTGLISLYYYQTNGLVSSIWVSIAYFIGTTITFVLLLMYSHKGYWTLVEKIALVGVVIVFIFRIILNSSPIFALSLTMVIDIIGAIPLVVAVYKDSTIDYKFAWFLGLISNIINIFAVEKWDYNNAGYPIYMVILTFTVTILLYFPNFLRKIEYKVK